MQHKKRQNVQLEVQKQREHLAAWRAGSLSQMEVLNNVIALGRKGFLHLFLWQCSWISLFEKELCCLSRSGWSGLSRRNGRLLSILLSTTASMVSSWQPITKPAFLITLSSLLVLPAPLLLPQQIPAKNSSAGNNRLVEDGRHPAAHAEGSRLPHYFWIEWWIMLLETLTREVVVFFS